MIPLPKRTLRAFLEKQRASGFADLDGALLTGSIPLSEALINAVIRDTAPEALKRAHLTLQDDNRVGLDLTVSVPVLGELRFHRDLAVGKRIKQNNALLLQIRIVESSLFDKVKDYLIGLLASQHLPSFVALRGSEIEIDLGEILRQQAIAREILPFLRSLDIEGRPGKLILHFRLEAA